MRSRLACVVSTVAVVTAFAAWGGRAAAQGDGGAGGDPDPGTPSEPAPLPDAAAPADDTMPVAPVAAPPVDEVRFGAGIRLRRVVIPRGLLELFVEQAATGVSGTGFGIELARRRGDFELQLGFEYEGLDGDPGIWVEKDKRPGPGGDEVDYVEFRDFGWFTLEVTFLNHTRLGKMVALRYGGGAGIGIMKGDVVRTDYRCSVSTLDRETLRNVCMGYPGSENNQTPYDLPPVFPVINALIGLQIRPVENIVINIEGGIRTMPFFGATAGYYF